MANILYYGAGENAKFNLESYIKKTGEPVCFVDASKHKQYTRLEIGQGYEIFPLDVAVKKYPDYELWLTLTPANIPSARESLIKQGIKPERIHYLEDIDFGNTEQCKHYCAVVKKNFIQLDDERKNALKSLVMEYPSFQDNDFLQSEDDKKRYHGALYGRLNLYREKVIPWLESIKPLNNARILEIGCGPDPSTVALCEQGAIVTAIDIDRQFLEIAKKRLDIYGLRADFLELNAAEIKDKLNSSFDFIIYMASLEHMTYSERITTIKAAYDMIVTGGYIVVCDTPNRLWHNDTHTSFEPFYHWLPDELAVEYAKFVPRETFGRADLNQVGLARWGRGVSYHEFEIAVGRGNLQLVSHRDSFFPHHDRPFKKMLKMVGPEHIADGWYEEWLNIALQK